MLGRKYIIKVRRNPFTEGINIYFGLEDSKGLFVAKPVELKYEKVDDTGRDVEPSLFIPRGLASGFLEAVLDAIEREGIKSKSTATVEGLLEATKYHLEDMRKLVFSKEEKK